MIKKDKIKISKFVAEYEKYATDNLKANYVQRVLDVADYIPYEKKMLFAENIVNTTSWLRVDGEKTRIMINSPVKYLLYCRCIINVYTNLEDETDNWFDEYNALNKSGLLEVILGLIPERELSEFKTVLSMTYDDFMTNNYGVHAYVSNQVERFGNLIGITLSPYMDKLAAAIEGIDDSKIEKFMGLVNKFMK